MLRVRVSAQDKGYCLELGLALRVRAIALV